MTENAKQSADESAEQKGWAEQEQTELPKTNSTDGEIGSEDDVTTEAETLSEEKSVKDVADFSDQNEDKDAADVKLEISTSTGDEDVTDDAPLSSKTDDNNEDATVSKDNAAATKVDDKSNIEISIEIPDKSSGTKHNASQSDFQESLREQIENCKFEIVAALQDTIHAELKDYTAKQIRKVERRRRAGAIIRDVIILLLAMLVGYFGYCLYDAKYFDFLKSDCERNGTCEADTTNDKAIDLPAEVVKDTTWYKNNYGYLFDSLKTNLSADKVDAYYLYSGDYRLTEIQPAYLLAMAYNHLNSNITYDSDKGIMVPADDLKASFINLFGSADLFVKQGFTYDCADFTYDRESDSFITPHLQCTSNANRQIVEEIDKIYEEGNALYFLSTAAIFDQAEQSFYSFDNLFKPAATNAEKTDFSQYTSVFNKYQYRFKKVDDNYYFSDIIKLR